jgi:hypothetical protein
MEYPSWLTCTKRGPARFEVRIGKNVFDVKVKNNTHVVMSKNNKEPIRKNQRRMATFFGETKSLKEWIADPRSKCPDYQVLYYRTHTVPENWPGDLAITTPPQPTPGRPRN